MGVHGFANALSTVRLHNEQLYRAKSSVNDKVRQLEEYKSACTDNQFDPLTHRILNAMPANLQPDYAVILCDAAIPSDGILDISLQALMHEYQPLMTIKLEKKALKHTQNWLLHESPVVGFTSSNSKAFRVIFAQHLIEKGVKEFSQRMRNFSLQNKPKSLSTTTILQGLFNVAQWEVSRNTRTNWLTTGLASKALACDRETACFMARLFNLMPRTPLAIGENL